MLRPFWGLLLLASGLSAQQYPFIPVDNSPRNIEHILEDREGRLWVSTHDDLLCFDGARFFSLRPLGFPAAFSSTLREDHEGGILTATPFGVYRYYEGHVEQVFQGPVADAVSVSDGVLLVTGPGVAATAGNPLYRIRRTGTRWNTERITGWLTGNNLTRNRAGTIFVWCPGGWCELTPQLIEAWTPDRPGSPVRHESKADLVAGTRDRFGCLWLRNGESGSYQCPGDAQPVALPASVIGRNVWSAMTENEDGSMLFANVGSVAIGRPGAFRVVTPDQGLPAEAVTCAVRARDGTIWIGSIAGLYRFPYPFRMSSWKSRHGLVWSFAKSGRRMVSGTSAGVARLEEDGSWTVLAGSREFGSISSLVTEPDGGLYAAVAREAVIHLRPDGSLAERTPPGMGGLASTLAKDPGGRLWLGGSGIYRVIESGRSLSLIPDNPQGVSLSDAQVASGGGALWGCFPGRVVRREGDVWRTMAQERVPADGCRSLAPLSNGDVWAGYWNSLALVRGGFAHVFPQGGGIVTPVSYSIAPDTRGWIWRGTPDGIYVADSSQAERGQWVRLNEIDGLTDTDVNHGSLFADPDGSVWWAAAASIVHFNPPADLVHPSSLPAVFLSGFSLNGGQPQLADGVTQLRSVRKLMAHIGSLQFQGRNGLGIRYRLLPQQKDWHESATLDLDLTSARWGSHTLELQSRFSMGNWSPTQSWAFGILRPWWLSWQALLLFAGLSGGSAAGAAGWRRKRRARAQTELPDLSSWRMAALSPESRLKGTILGSRFEVLDLVARGGFATVLKGSDLDHSGRACAIKIFRKDVLDERWLDHRFQQEVLALEQIRHPSVVSFYGHGIAPSGAPYLAMEFIEGGTLRDLLEAGPLAPERAATLLQQAADAIAAIHAHGIYHRDLKPENLMLRTGAAPGEELVLIDFSIAIVKEPDQTIHGLSRAAGTIYYMAPEQAVGFATPASDIYSLAKIVLEMLTGERLSTLLPHASMDLPERVRELLGRLPIRLSAESVELLGAALEFDPARRPQSALRFGEPVVRDLFAASSGLSASRVPSSRDDEPAAG